MRIKVSATDGMVDSSAEFELVGQTWVRDDEFSVGYPIMFYPQGGGYAVRVFSGTGESPDGSEVFTSGQLEGSYYEDDESLTSPLIVRVSEMLRLYPCDVSTGLDSRGRRCGGRAASYKDGGREVVGPAFKVTPEKKGGQKLEKPAPPKKLPPKPKPKPPKGEDGDDGGGLFVIGAPIVFGGSVLVDGVLVSVGRVGSAGGSWEDGTLFVGGDRVVRLLES